MVAVTDVRELGIRHADISLGRAKVYSISEEE